MSKWTGVRTVSQAPTDAESASGQLAAALRSGGTNIRLIFGASLSDEGGTLMCFASLVFALGGIVLRGFSLTPLSYEMG